MYKKVDFYWTNTGGRLHNPITERLYMSKDDALSDLVKYANDTEMEIISINELSDHYVGIFRNLSEAAASSQIAFEVYPSRP